MSETRYTRHMTIACPKALMEDANHLAVSVGTNEADFGTFANCNYKKGFGQYCVVAFPCPPEFFDILVAEPQQRDFAPKDWSKTKAEAAQAALLIYQGEGDMPQAQAGKIVVIADMEPLAAIAKMGLTLREVDVEL